MSGFDSAALKTAPSLSVTVSNGSFDQVLSACFDSVRSKSFSSVTVVTRSVCRAGLINEVRQLSWVVAIVFCLSLIVCSIW